MPVIVNTAPLDLFFPPVYIIPRKGAPCIVDGAPGFLAGGEMSERKLVFGRYDYAAYSAFCFYSVCSFSVPLLIVAIGRALDFPLDGGGMAAGGLLHMVRSAAMMVTLVLCGLISARFGKRLTMGTGVMLIGTGISCCSFAPSYLFLFPALLVAGAGEGICEGIATPFVQDLHPDAPERYVNIAHAFWPAGILLAVVMTGWMLSAGIGWRSIMGLMGLMTVVSGMAFFWPEDPRNPCPEREAHADAAAVLKQAAEIFRVPRFWRCCLGMFFGAGAEFGLTFWAAAYIELNFGAGALLAGAGTAVIALGMFAGRTFFGCIARPENLLRILLCSSLGTIPVTLALAWLKPGILPPAATAALLFLLLLLAGVGIAPYWPTMQVYGVSAMPRLNATMLYVAFSAMGIPGCGFFAWFIGAAGIAGD